ncbi:hypothetical protein [Streptomyces sp. NPDC048623]|uniref:hypothetical protein n=1 Tax=Streptomyces sp. NPDC048623 TaxID=3155761 RepID=UPI00342D6C70
MTHRKARLPVPTTRIGWSGFDLLESVPGLVILGMNAVGLALAGSLVADEIDSARGLAAASVPDLEPYAEEQPQHDAANATASSIRTYRYESPVTGPAHQTAPLPLHGGDLRGEVWPITPYIGDRPPTLEELDQELGTP